MKNLTKALGYFQVIIFWLLSTPLFAQNVNVHLVSGRDFVGTEGDTIRVPIIMDTIYTNDVVAENIIAMNLEFTYGTQLTPLSFTTANGILSSWQVNTVIDQTSSKFSFTAAGTAPILQDSGVLFYVDFLLKDVTTVTNPTYSLSTTADNYFNEGGYDFTMDYGQIKINPILQLNVSAGPTQITVGDSTKINVSGGTPPYTYAIADPSFGSLVSTDYFLAGKYGSVEVHVSDVNGLLGSTSVEVRPFRLAIAGPDYLVLPGNNFQIAITTTDVSQLNVVSGNFDFTVQNSSDVRFKAIVTQGTLLEGANIEINEGTANTFSIAFARSTALATGDTLLKVEFESDIEAINSYNVSLQNNIVFNENLLGTTGSSDAAQFINLTAPNLSYPSGNYIRNEQIQFTGSAGQAPYSWSVSDETIGVIDPTGLLTLLKGGNIAVTITDSLGLSKTSDLFIYDARVDIADQTAPADSRYNLPVEITELAADRGFSSFFFEITYDPNSVDFVGLDQIGTLLEGFSVAQNQIANNVVRVVGASQAQKTSAGILTNLTFDLLPGFLEGQTTSVSFSKITFNEGEPVPIAVNGSIKVGIAPTTGDTLLVIDEDENYNFQAVDFIYNHADNSKTFSGIKIERLPSKGTLYSGTSPITSLTTVSVNSFSSFTYKPAANESGLSYDSFEFKVFDGSYYSNYNGTIRFDVNAINDNPSFEVSESTVTVLEDFASSSIVSLTPNPVPVDEQGEVVSYSISPESVDFANVVFDPTALTITFSSVADSSGIQVFSIIADDGQTANNTSEKLVTLTVQSVNDIPVFNNQTFAIDENLGNGSLVAEVVATDKDSNISYAITAGNTNNAFTLSNTGILTVNDFNALDFETTPSFTLSVDVMDEITTVSATITINLTDVDEAVNQAPQILAQTFNIDENSDNGSVVGTIIGFDPDGDALTYAITAGNTNNAFAIDAATGSLTVANVSALDFETTPSFSLTVQVADASLNASATITVDLNDIFDSNQSPVIANQSFNVNENSANGTFIATISASDPDGDLLTYSITAGNTNNAFALDPSTGDLIVANVTALDFETSPTFTLTIQVADAALNTSANITINLTDVDETVNQAPQIVAQVLNIDENSVNGTVVGTIIGFDPDGDALTYTITAGNTNNAFAIDAASGSLTVANVSALDFETTPSFSLTVQVADASLNASATITVDLNDIFDSNQSPVIANQSFNVNENSADGTFIATISASDPDRDLLTYSITAGNTNNAFAIDPSTGDLVVANVTALDFETSPTFTLTVQVADAALSVEATMSINLNNINEVPVIVGQTFSIDENSPDGTSIGNVVATDPDGDAVTYSIISGNTNNAFVIDAGTGSLTVANVSALDFETTPSFSLTVQVADAALTAAATITVNLLDVVENNKPVITAQTFSIDENSPSGTEVGIVTATDPDGDNLNFSITTRNDGGAFSISSTSGRIAVTDPTNLDFELNTSFSLNIVVNDGQLSSEALITINLNDVDENVLGLKKAVELTIYPNPVFDYLKLSGSENLSEGLLIIHNLQGQELKRFVINNDNQYDVTDLNLGIYVVLLKQNGQLNLLGTLIKQ